MNNISLSKNNTTHSLAAITADDSVPSNKQQASTLIDYFSHVWHIKPHHTDRQIIRKRTKFSTDPNHKPFTYDQAKHIINNLKTPLPIAQTM